MTLFMREPPCGGFPWGTRQNWTLTDLMNKALNYMLNGWAELQNYRMDGHYTIDKMIAERVIRPFTIIETAKMHGLEVS